MFALLSYTAPSVDASRRYEILFHTETFVEQCQQGPCDVGQFMIVVPMFLLVSLYYVLVGRLGWHKGSYAYASVRDVQCSVHTRRTHSNVRFNAFLNDLPLLLTSTKSVRNHRDKEYSNTSLLVYGNGDGGGGPLSSMIERLRRMRNVVWYIDEKRQLVNTLITGSPLLGWITQS